MAKAYKGNYQIICKACNGSGEILYTGEETCSKCRGIGRITGLNSISLRCRACNGNGKVFYRRTERCKQCSGIGKILV